MLRKIDLLSKMIKVLKENETVINGKKYYESTEEFKKLFEEWSKE